MVVLAVRSARTPLCPAQVVTNLYEIELELWTRMGEFASGARGFRGKFTVQSLRRHTTSQGEHIICAWSTFGKHQDFACIVSQRHLIRALGVRNEKHTGQGEQILLRIETNRQRHHGTLQARRPVFCVLIPFVVIVRRDRWTQLVRDGCSRPL